MSATFPTSRLQESFENPISSSTFIPVEDTSRVDLHTTRDYTQFDPRAYLREYYSDIGGENYALLEFFVGAYRTLPANSTLLDFGGGPTLYQLIAAVSHVKTIHFCDYLVANLAEVLKWLRHGSAAFNWRPFVQATLEIERGHSCSDAAVLQREALLRRAISRVTTCDIRFNPPVRGAISYDAVVSNFCAEAAATTRHEWLIFLNRITSLVRPKGKVIITSVKEASSYSVGPRVFSAVRLNEGDLAWGLIAAGCHPESIHIRSVPSDRPSRHYQGLMLATAEKL